MIIRQLNIPFTFLSYQMRLRKRTLKTQFSEPCVEHSRFKLLKRQTTELYRKQNKSQDEVIQSSSGTSHHMKFKSKFTSSGTPSNPFKEFTNQMNQLSWRKFQFPPAQSPKRVSIRKSSDTVNQMALLNNHLLNIGVRPKRNNKRTATEPCLSLKTSRTKRQYIERQPMEGKVFDRCCQIVDQIYSKVKSLKELGYAQFKINEWVLAYCDNRRPYMKDIFMKNVSKSLYTLQQEFQLQKNSKIIKEKLKFKIEKGRDIFYFIQQEQLAELCKHLEEILIQKNSQKAREVESSIVQKLSNEFVPRLKNNFFVFTKKDPVEVSNFAIDLNQFQQRYGDFISLSKVNKLKFLQLNRVETNLKNVYQTMLQSEIKKIVKQSQQNHPTPICTKHCSGCEQS